MKVESRQIPQKLAASLKFVCCQVEVRHWIRRIKQYKDDIL